MSIEPLELAGLMLAIGEQPSEDLPRIAADALTRGLDSPALREAAGTSVRDVRDAAEKFRTALDELGMPVPDEQEALWALARHAAQQIVAGQRDPIEGAGWIWAHISHRIRAEGDLRTFIAIASEYEDHPEDREHLEALARTAAAELLERHRPRTWLQLRATRREHPLRDPAIDQPVDPASLTISSTLRRRLTDWRDWYDSVLDGGGFDSAAEAESFVGQGLELVAVLQDELGAEWHVEYMPEPTAPPGLRLAP